MPNLGFKFDARGVEPAKGSPPPLPTDWYNVMITDSEIVKTKDAAKQNFYLELTLKVMDGHYAGRTVRDRLNLWNDNPMASEIAQKSLSAICHATGVWEVEDSHRLHGIPMMARVIERDPEGSFDASNEVRGYVRVGEKESKNGSGQIIQPKSGGTPPAAAAPAAAAPGAVPWAQPAAPTPTPAPAAPAAPAPAQPWAPPAAPAPAAPAAPSFTPPPGPPAGHPPAPPAPPAPHAPPAAPGASPVPPWQR